MKNLFKKNQLMITALAIMIAVAGYLQFAGDNLEDEKYVETSAEVGAEGQVESFTESDLNSDYSLDGLLDLSEEDLEKEGYVEIDSLDADLDVIMEDTAELASTENVSETADTQTPTEGEIPGEAVFTSTSSISSLSDARMMKEQVRAKNKETLLEIINSTTLSDEQKQSAVDSMVSMTSIAETEMSAELLLEAKGFSDVIVSISENGVDVVVNAAELSDAQRAQIEDIIKRKTGVEATAIIISTVVQD